MTNNIKMLLSLGSLGLWFYFNGKIILLIHIHIRYKVLHTLDALLSSALVSIISVPMNITISLQMQTFYRDTT